MSLSSAAQSINRAAIESAKSLLRANTVDHDAFGHLTVLPEVGVEDWLQFHDALEHCALTIYLQRIYTTRSVRAQIDFHEHYTSICSEYRYASPGYSFGCMSLSLLARLNEDQKLYDSIENPCVSGD